MNRPASAANCWRSPRTTAVPSLSVPLAETSKKLDWQISSSMTGPAGERWRLAVTRIGFCQVNSCPFSIAARSLASKRASNRGGSVALFTSDSVTSPDLTLRRRPQIQGGGQHLRQFGQIDAAIDLQVHRRHLAHELRPVGCRGKIVRLQDALRSQLGEVRIQRQSLDVPAAAGGLQLGAAAQGVGPQDIGAEPIRSPQGQGSGFQTIHLQPLPVAAFLPLPQARRRWQRPGLARRREIAGPSDDTAARGTASPRSVTCPSP